MEGNTKDMAIYLFESCSAILKAMPAKERYDMDEMEIVFADNLNGRLKANRTYGFIDAFQALEDGGKPVGLIILNWEDPENMAVKEFPGLTTEEASLLMHSFAEAQDQAKENHEE